MMWLRSQSREDKRERSKVYLEKWISQLSGLVIHLHLHGLVPVHITWTDGANDINQARVSWV